MLNNKNFYPTPPALAQQMCALIDGTPDRILEPSAGKGDLVEAVNKVYGYHSKPGRIAVIESDPDLQATLRGKGYELIDSDFLSYSAPDSFDLIIANPPFDEGEKHLLKAINIMYRGQIIFLLNAETLRNQCTMSRKELSKKLRELNAQIRFIPDAFLDAERTTKVEIALISLKIENSLDQDMFNDVVDEAAECNEKIGEKHDLSTGRTIEELVAEYNEKVRLCTDTVLEYMKNFPKVRNYLKLGAEGSDDYVSKHCTDRTAAAQNLINGILTTMRKEYWRKVLNIEAVHSRMTEKKRNEFNDQIESQSKMDFTEKNIRQFIINLIGSYEQTLVEAVADIFDKMTIKYAWDEQLHNGNVHYYNGWKTNDAFKVNHRVVIPIYASYGHPFVDYCGNWKLDYKAAGTLRDIDLVMNYFDGMDHFSHLTNAIERAFADGKSTGQSTYFKFRCFKKGTIHLTFLDDDIRRRFNLCAAKHKGWLPQDYGAKPVEQLTLDERRLVDAFEDSIEEYKANVGKPELSVKENQFKLTA